MEEEWQVAEAWSVEHVTVHGQPAASSNHKTTSPRPALGSHISGIQNIQRHAASTFSFTTREGGTGMDSNQVHSLWVLLY